MNSSRDDDVVVTFFAFANVICPWTNHLLPFLHKIDNFAVVIRVLSSIHDLNVFQNCVRLSLTSICLLSI